MAYVYGHYTTDTGELFYIGKGTGNRAWVTKYRNYYWKQVAKNGFDVKILYDNLSEEEAFSKEKELIAEIGLENLTNITEGGNGNTRNDSLKLHQNPEFRKKHLEACKLSARRPAWRKKQSEILKNKWNDIEFANKRKEMFNSDEWFDAYMKGREALKQDPNWRENVSNANKEKAHDPEWKAKQRAGVQKSHKENPQRGKNHSDRMKELWKNPEFKRKMMCRGKKGLDICKEM